MVTALIVYALGESSICAMLFSLRVLGVGQFYVAK